MATIPDFVKVYERYSVYALEDPGFTRMATAENDTLHEFGWERVEAHHLLYRGSETFYKAIKGLEVLLGQRLDALYNGAPIYRVEMNDYENLCGREIERTIRRCSKYNQHHARLVYSYHSENDELLDAESSAALERGGWRPNGRNEWTKRFMFVAGPDFHFVHVLHMAQNDWERILPNKDFAECFSECECCDYGIVHKMDFRQ